MEEKGEIRMEGHIAVTLVTRKGFRNALVPEEMVLELAEALRTIGTIVVGFENEDVLAEGLIITSKDADHELMIVPREDENEEGTEEE